jgi:hypothetical protein
MMLILLVAQIYSIHLMECVITKLVGGAALASISLHIQELELNGLCLGTLAATML